MVTTPFSLLMGGIAAIILGVLLRTKVLSFGNTGNRVQTVCFWWAVLSIPLAVIWVVCLSETSKQRLSRMTPFQRRMFWPFPQHIRPRDKASGDPNEKPPVS